MVTAIYLGGFMTPKGIDIVVLYDHINKAANPPPPLSTSPMNKKSQAKIWQNLASMAEACVVCKLVYQCNKQQV